MAILTETYTLDTKGSGEIIDITSYATTAIERAGMNEGMVMLFAAHSTCGITAMEFEPGAVEDLAAWFENHIPVNAPYSHNRRNHDTNGHAHLRAALVGPSVSIPIVGGSLALGTWQTPVLIDFDDRPRRRRLLVQVLGE